MADSDIGRELAVPFSIDANGSVATVATRAQILINHVTAAIGTQPTERVMRPTYGCDVQQFAFSLGDEGVLKLINSTVKKSMALLCPEALFIGVTAVPPGPDGVFVVAIKFSDALDPRSNPITATLEFAVQGDGGTVVEEGF